MRIAVVRALHGLGDMLCAVPALNALRRAYPLAEVTLIGLPCCAWLLERFGNLVDELLPFPGFPGIPEQPYSGRALIHFLTNARRRPFDLALQMHGSGVITNHFVELLGARSIAGLYESGRRRPDGRFFPYPHRGPEARRWLYLTHSLKLPSDDERIRFPVSPADRAALALQPALRQLAIQPFVCIHPGARDPARRWSPRRFALVADGIAKLGYRIVLTGTTDERDAAAAVASHMRTPAIDASGGTSLGVVAALLERAALVVTNDTGLSHLAVAVGTPSVIVFLASDADRWAPIDTTLHRPVLGRHVASGFSRCMRKSAAAVPGAAEVLEEAFELLERGVAA